MTHQRKSLAISSVAHAAVLAYALINFSSPRPFEVGATESMAVEVLSPTEFEQITKGSKTSKVVAPPQVKAQKSAPAAPEPKPDDLPEAKQDVAATAAPPPPAPEPTPKAPEPPKAEAKPPEPKVAEQPKPPEPKTPEPKVAEQPKPPEPKPQKPEPPKPEAKPPEKAVQQQPAKPPEPKRTFDPTKIAALVDKRDPARTASVAPQPAAATSAGLASGTASKLSLSERRLIDGYVRDQVQPCWSPPVGASGAQDLQVRVRFSLNADGSLAGMPEVVNSGSGANFQAAADSATRAVRRCAPLKLPVASYDYWKEVEITFDPRDMVGG